MQAFYMHFQASKIINQNLKNIFIKSSSTNYSIEYLLWTKYVYIVLMVFWCEKFEIEATLLALPIVVGSLDICFHSIQLCKCFMEGRFKPISNLSIHYTGRLRNRKKDKQCQRRIFGRERPKHYQRHTVHMADKHATVMRGTKD